MNLNELASACHLYNTKTNFDSSYLYFLKVTDNSLDLNKAKHRKAMLVWLNSWKCRQFIIAYHDFASAQIHKWYINLNYLLPEKSKNIWELSGNDFDKIKILYDTLSNTQVAKKIKNKKEVINHAGPTGASKILFALRPKSLMLWDGKMRDDLGKGDDSLAYIEYLQKAKQDIEILIKHCKLNGFTLQELPEKINRSYSTIPKILDEYRWVTVTKGWQVPKLNKFITCAQNNMEV